MKMAALPALRTRAFWKDLAGELRLMFGRPPRMQFAALCYRRRKNGSHEILLVTSRDTGRWVTPKGWPMEGRSAAEVATIEAHEEAGMIGKADAKPLGRFAYDKRMNGGLSIRCVAQVHALEVTGSEKSFREKGQRRVAWFSPEEAANLVAEPGLRKIILNFRPAPEA